MAGDSAEAVMRGILIVFAVVVVYFIPAFAAYARHHRSRQGILLLNLFLGITVLGWIISLVWAYTGNIEPPVASSHVRGRLALLALFGGVISMTLVVPAVSAQTPTGATVVFYRSTGFQGNPLHASIKVDRDAPLYKIRNNRFWKTEIAPGEHLIYGDDERFGRRYALESGNTYYFRVETHFPGRTLTGKLRFRVIAVSSDIAAAEMTGLKPDD